MLRTAPYIYADDLLQEAPAPTHLRASRGHSQPTKRRRTQDGELLDELATRQYQQRRGLRTVPSTDADEQIAPGAWPGQFQPRPQRGPLPSSVWFSLGMLILLVLLWCGVRVCAWYMNTFHDPLTYTQTAHKDTVTVTDPQGKQYQVRAFVDAENRVALLVIPGNDAGKARILVGEPTNIDNPQQAMLSVTASGTEITVTALGPVVPIWFSTSQQGAQYNVDITQKQQGG